ncbi:hypothetical protein SCHPADRAFT_435370 [Schizopora paradoxa]|uniref:Uncharacterized protein n=1 Tax=Schizopora paradoxa TaxID=27342 RepID=A0A0H2RJE2_9AGAM|nr:hypothetical protein SCHPADRAFT_435370 [Schizopora paradoxa]
MSNDQHNALNRFGTFSSSTRSMATSPDVVGPGRTLGLLFDWLGKGLESFLNKRASQLNLGPEAVARDIRRIRRHEQTSLMARYAAPYAHLTKAREKQVRKLCEKLLKYVRSHVQSTQLEALYEIMELSMQDRVVREILLNLGIKRLIPNFKETELALAMSKTIYFVENTEIHELWDRLYFSGYSRYGYSSVESEDVKLLKKFLSDPNSSFIVARHLSRLESDSHPGYINNLLAQYFDLTVTNPDIIEWSNLNTIGFGLTTWPYMSNVPYTYRPDIIENLVRRSKSLIRFFEGALNVRGVKFLSMGPGDGTGESFSFTWKEEEVPGASVFMTPSSTGFRFFKDVLDTLTGSKDFKDHISFLRKESGQTQNGMKIIPIGNEVLVIVSYILNHVREAGSSVCDRRHLPLHQEHNSSQNRSADEDYSIDRLKVAIELLVAYCGAKQVKDRALAAFYIKAISALGRYYKYAFQHAPHYHLYFSQQYYFCDSDHTNLMQDLYYNRRLDLLQGGVNILWRIRAKGKHFILRYDSPGRYGSPRGMRGNCCILDLWNDHVDRIDVTLIPFGTAIPLARSDLRSPFNLTSHYPILAFYDGSGEPHYLAFFCKDGIHGKRSQYIFTAFKEGDTAATWYDEFGRAHIAQDFEPVVLRNDPIDFQIGNDIYSTSDLRPRAGSLDHTGPIYWLQYFPKRDPELFEDIECEILRWINGMIMSQNGESAIEKSPWLRESIPCRSWKCRCKVPSSFQYSFGRDDDSEPTVSPLGSEVEAYYSEAESESPPDEIIEPSMDGQNYPSLNKDLDTWKEIAEDADRNISDGPPNSSEGSGISENFAEDDEGMVEAEEVLDVGPIPGEETKEDLRRTIEEKDKEIAMLRAMLSKNSDDV